MITSIHFKKLALIVVLFIPILAGAQSFTFEKTPEGAWVKEHGKKVLFYQSATKSKNGQYPRADYIHPLYGIDGEVLTEDFPDDHLHQRGIFWAWHQIYVGEKRVADAWECKDFVWDVQKVKRVKSDGNSLAFSAKTFWKSPLWKDNHGKMKAFVEENTKVTVHAEKENYRIVDFEISLLALEPKVSIGGSEDEKGYSGFSVRMKMPEDIKFTSENGEVLPTTKQLNAGPWINVSGSLAKDGGQAGIAMMCHPDNPVFPDPWILRTKGSMQNPAFPGRKPVLISEKELTVLRYRLVVFKGNMSKELLDGIQEKY